MLLPAAAGAAVYLVGSSPTVGVIATPPELIAINGMALLLALPSIWLMTRFGLSTYGVIQDGQTPLTALKLARRLTLGRFWKVLGRLAFLVIILFVLGAVAYVPTMLLGLVYKNNQVLDALYQTILSLLALPLINLYLFKLYRELKNSAGA